MRELKVMDNERELGEISEAGNKIREKKRCQRKKDKARIEDWEEIE